MKAKPEALTRDQAVRIAVAVAAELTARSPQPWVMISEKPGEGNIWSGSIRLGAREGHGVYLRFDGYGNEGRITVSGLWPAYKDNRGSIQTISPSVRECGENDYKPITVARDKDPDKIGADIRARFIGPYLKLHAMMAVRAAQYQTSAEKALEVASKLAVKHSTRKPEGDGQCANFYVNGVGSLRVSWHSDGASVYFGNIGSISLTKADKILAILKED